MTKDKIVWHLKGARLSVVSERTKIAENTLRSVLKGRRKTRASTLDALAKYFGGDGYVA